ncbi:metallophosphoesterase [Mycobacterium sp. 155]|uniref:metallophosphoesterase family protein n=1 Tax=Mycobacterium sp. 155 TaxID=1157943 RepID=UPI0003668778|nr:metallophosphoesterase [Mycobacterium sp. 155]
MVTTSHPRRSSERSTRPEFFATPARIAIAGDWHADTEYGVAAIRHAARRNVSVLVHLGDFGFNFTDEYLDALDRALRRHDMVLGFVDGNHENFDRLLAWPVSPDGLRYLRERVIHLPRGLRWQWGNTRCLAVGGAYSIDKFLRTPGKTWWPQEMITPEQARDIAAAGRADVMFCHDCPAGIVVPGAAADRYGCPPEELATSEMHRALLRSIVDAVRPARLWHGHFHHRYRALLTGPDYRTVIDGLGKNGNPIDNNMVAVNLDELGHHRFSFTGDESASPSTADRAS